MNALRTPLSIAALLFASQSASALSAPDDQSPGSPEHVRQALAILPRVGTNQIAVMPTLPAVSLAVQPGLTAGEDWLKVLHETLEDTSEPSRLAEGAFVLARPGKLIPGPNAMLIFVPDKATQQPGEGPVLLMPCQTLEQLETEWTGQSVEVSGEIFTYHNRNQLLISAYRIGSSEPAESPSADPQSSESPSPDIAPSDADTPTSIEDDPAVRDLLDELSFNTGPADTASSPTRQVTDPSPSIRSRSQVTTSSTTIGIDEGTLIMRRPSRMIRNSSGAWTIVFDHDNPSSIDAIDLIVQPCRMLMGIERVAMDEGDAGQLLVSGRVYTYKGDHYILPTLMQRIRPQGLSTIQ